MKKVYIFPLFIILAIFLAYNAVYFEKLSSRTANMNSEFDFIAYADSIFYKGILLNDNSIEISQLITKVRNNPDSTFKQYGNRLGIGESAYFMIKVKGKLHEKTSDDLIIVTQNGVKVRIDTKYIFGNAIRDASGMVKLTDFKTNADFNKVSEALNAIIREKAIPENLKSIQQDDIIAVRGALKLNKAKIEFENLEISPIQIIKE
jgi:predicted lipoprotein